MPMLHRAPIVQLLACACSAWTPTQASADAAVYAGARTPAGPARDWCDVSPAESGNPAAVKLIARATQHLVKTPHPLPRPHAEGTLPHQSIYDESVVAAQDFPLMRDATLAAAIDWLTPYADGSHTHEEYVHSHVPFDKKRADAGLPGFSGPWDPKSAGTLYWQAARLDPNYRPLAATAPDWLVLCAAR